MSIKISKGQLDSQIIQSQEIESRRENALEGQEKEDMALKIGSSSRTRVYPSILQSLAAINGDEDAKDRQERLQKGANNIPDARTSKVPRITLAFWVIKCCSTNLGETLSDHFTTKLGLGITSQIFYPTLLIVLSLQFAVRKYIPVLYWLTVVLMSICGTILTDGIHDNLGLDLWIEMIIFSFFMGIWFVAWYISERTLDIDSIKTMKREVFYWVAILFTFALGTAFEECMAETFKISYGCTLLIFLFVIILIAAMWYLLKLDDVECFWIAYIMTRPLGSALGNLLSASTDEGAAGLGTTYTSLIFLAIIAISVGFLTYSKHDEIKSLGDLTEMRNYEAIPVRPI